MEAKKSKPRKAKLPELPFYQKYLLTMDETAVYFRIGSDRMRSLIRNNPDAKWFIKVGQRKMIKKDMFALWLD